MEGRGKGNLKERVEKGILGITGESKKGRREIMGIGGRG